MVDAPHKALVVMLLLAGCPAEPVEPAQSSPPYSEARAVTSLAIAADGELVVPRGETVQLSLAATFDEDEAATDVTAATTWRVADPSIAAVNSDGTIEGLLEGVTTAWGEYAGIPSAPLELEVVRGRWNVEFVGGSGSGTRGKLLDIELRTNDTTFASAETVELSIDGLIPFGEDRVVEPWWGVPDGQPNRYRARFLVPPTLTPGPHELVLSLDGRPPENTLMVDIDANSSLANLYDCDFFANDGTSNWTFEADGNNSRTWLVGDLARSTNTRILAMPNTPGGVDPYMVLWSSQDGEVVATSDDDPEFGNDGAAGVQFSSLNDVFGEGAYYLTVTVSPMAVGNALGGTIATTCEEEMMPDPMRPASNAATLFADGGATILPGSATEDAEFAGVSGTVARVWVYLDMLINQPDFTTVTLIPPGGDASDGVELISPNWSADWLPESNEWVGGLGGPSPFVPVSDVWANPTVANMGTDSFAGISATGTWTVSVTMAAATNGGLWRDARLYIETQ